MVGRKFIVACIERFRRVCQNLSCQKEPSSPTHSVGNPPDLTTTNRTVINTISEKVVEEEMGNKPLKLPDIEPSVLQERVLDIIKEQKTPLKETNFSPYTPLPAIGKSSLEGLKCKIVRQKTYRVLDPIYIKGPSDLYKFIPKTDSEVAGSVYKKVKCSCIAQDGSNGHSGKGTFKKVRQIGNENHKVVDKTEKMSNIQLKERNLKPPSFYKSVVKPINKRDSNELGFNQDQRSKNVDKENATAFWIDF